MDQGTSRRGSPRALLEQALGGFESGDVTVFEQVVAPDAVVRNPSVVMHGPDELARSVQEAFITPFSDRRVEIIGVIESGNSIAAEIRTVARHTGTMRLPLGDLPPSGNTVTLEEASLIRVHGDKIIYWRFYYDLMAVLR